MANSRCASVSTITGSSVDCEIRLAVKKHHQERRLGEKGHQHFAARARLPKAVPISIAASARNTRASAKMPTRAMTSAPARTAGRWRWSHDAGRQRHAGKDHVGREAEQRRAWCAITASLWNSLRSVR